MIKEAKVIYSPEADHNDLMFWKSRSFEEKISVVQGLREQYIRLFHKETEYDESRKRLRRFYRIIK
jgi:hypothetical protein